MDVGIQKRVGYLGLDNVTWGEIKIQEGPGKSGTEICVPDSSQG